MAYARKKSWAVRAKRSRPAGEALSGPISAGAGRANPFRIPIPLQRSPSLAQPSERRSANLTHSLMGHP